MYDAIVTFLQKPLTILATVIMGLSIGFYNPEMGTDMEPFGQAFMSLLEMSLIPIIICAIVLSISNLFSFKHKKLNIGRIIGLLVSMTLLVSFISALLTLVLDPSRDFLESDSLTIKKISTLSSIVDRTTDDPLVEKTEGGVANFLKASIPNNIFDALAGTKMLQVIVFSIIFGIAIAFMARSERIKVQSFFETTLAIFQKIITSITAWLPLAIVALMAGGASQIGVEMLVQMSGFILKIYAIFAVIFVASTFVIALKTKKSFFEVIQILKDPIVIAFGTRSAILPIPAVLNAFDTKLNIDRSMSKLLVPLGAVLGRFGNIVYFAFLTVFVAGIYQTDITFSVFVVITILSLLAGLSSAGATGILTLAALSVVMDPLHLPLGAILPLLIAVDTIIDPMRTLTSVYTNCAAVVLVSPLNEEKQQKEKKRQKS